MQSHLYTQNINESEKYNKMGCLGCCLREGKDILEFVKYAIERGLKIKATFSNGSQSEQYDVEGFVTSYEKVDVILFTWYHVFLEGSTRVCNIKHYDYDEWEFCHIYVIYKFTIQ